MAKHYTLHAVTINGSTFSGMKSYSVNSGISFTNETHDGESVPSFGVVLEQKPTIRGTTEDVAGILGTIGLSGLAITGATGFVANWQQCTNKGTRTSGSNHLKCTATSGLAVVTGLNGQHNQITSVDFEIYLITADGVTAPLTWADSQALYGAADGTFSHYTLGPAVITASGATTIPCASWSLDPGVSVETDSTDGLPFPDFACLMNYAPKVTCSSPDMSLVTAAAPIAGQAVTACDLYLRKLAPSGSRVAAATTQHIKITFNGGIAYMDEQSGSDPGFASSSIMVHAVKGASALLSVSTSSALPT